MRAVVSIVIPVYNGANYLREAIDSALGQTYREVEVVVVNDGSTDGGKTAEAARPYGERIRYIEQANGGVAAALNHGLRAMRGEYFAWLSHDDLFLPGKIEAQVERMEREPGRGKVILYGDYDVIDAEGRVVGEYRIGKISPREMPAALVHGSPVNGCTTLIPRGCFERVGMFDETLRTTQDYQMWFRLAREFDFVHMDRKLMRSRVHPRQGSNTIVSHAAAQDRLYRWALDFLETEEVRAGDPSGLVVRSYLNMARSLLYYKGARGAARRAVWRGVRGLAADPAGSWARSAGAIGWCGVRDNVLARAFWRMVVRGKAPRVRGDDGAPDAGCSSPRGPGG